MVETTSVPRAWLPNIQDAAAPTLHAYSTLQSRQRQLLNRWPEQTTPDWSIGRPAEKKFTRLLLLRWGQAAVARRKLAIPAAAAWRRIVPGPAAPLATPLDEFAIGLERLLRVRLRAAAARRAARRAVAGARTSAAPTATATAVAVGIAAAVVGIACCQLHELLKRCRLGHTVGLALRGRPHGHHFSLKCKVQSRKCISLYKVSS